MIQKTSITLLLCLFASFLFSQVEYLRLSPSQKIIQKVGVTKITIEFSRPQAKGRKVFGELVPYNRLWRTGANENTTISFDHKVRIHKTDINAGKYALFTKPSETNWEIYLYTDTNNLDVPDVIESDKLIYLTTIESKTIANNQNTLTINFYDITEETANLGISWENTMVYIPISFYTQEAMELMIEKEFKQNVFDYSIAASYYAQRDVKLDKAKELQELSMELKRELTAWDYYNYGFILVKLKDKDNALKQIELGLNIVRDDDALKKMIAKSISQLKADKE